MSAFWQAVGFLTRFPVPKSARTLDGWESSPRYFPLVGLLLGASVWLAEELADALFGTSAAWLAAILTVAYWIFATGALHLDGWMDLADGLGSQRGRERALEIMKDSRVGAMGVVAAIVLILLKAAAVHQLVVAGGTGFLVAAPMLARWTLLPAIRYFPYVRENGLGNGLRQGVTPSVLAVNGALVITVIFVLAGMKGLIVALAVAASGWLFGKYIVRRLGGFTGDVYGAWIEAAETLALLAIWIRWPLMS